MLDGISDCLSMPAYVCSVKSNSPPYIQVMQIYSSLIDFVTDRMDLDNVTIQGDTLSRSELYLTVTREINVTECH
jgi:hypothetical protein